MHDQHSHSRAGWQSPLAKLVTVDSGLVLSLLATRYPDADSGQHAAWGASVEILQREGKVLGV